MDEMGSLNLFYSHYYTGYTTMQDMAFIIYLFVCSFVYLFTAFYHSFFYLFIPTNACIYFAIVVIKQ